jgi:hypothetical protein
MFAPLNLEELIYPTHLLILEGQGIATCMY